MRVEKNPYSLLNSEGSPYSLKELSRCWFVYNSGITWAPSSFEVDSNVLHMLTGIIARYGVSAGLVLSADWILTDLIAQVEVPIEVPDFISGMVETELGHGEMWDDITWMDNSKESVAREEGHDVVSEGLVAWTRWTEVVNDELVSGWLQLFLGINSGKGS